MAPAAKDGHYYYGFGRMPSPDRKTPGKILEVIEAELCPCYSHNRQLELELGSIGRYISDQRFLDLSDDPYYFAVSYPEIAKMITDIRGYGHGK